MTRWLDDGEQRAWRAILRSWRLIEGVLEEALDELGVSVGEYELLSMLSEAPEGRLRMAELAHLVVQSRSRVSHTATRLQHRGWVERLRYRQDGRGVVLALTDQGRVELDRLAPVHVESVRRALLEHITRDELIAQGDAMRKVVRAIRHSDDQATDAL